MKTLHIIGSKAKGAERRFCCFTGRCSASAASSN